MKNIYFDYAASTPVDKQVYKAMSQYFGKKFGLFGNPGSVHIFGQNAISSIDSARSIIAKELSAESDEIIFTGSATEANNLIIRGAIKSYYSVYSKSARMPRIIVSSIEHSSVIEIAKELERDGMADVVYVPVNDNGVVDVEYLKRKLSEDTILVSIMYVNNETGTIQPIEKIAKIISDFKLSNKNTQNNKDNIYPIFHTDAVQAISLNDSNVKKLGVDAMTISAHKIYGPKGIGALYLSRNIVNNNGIYPIITGGIQERSLRAGTQNTPFIVGFAEAIKICSKNKTNDRKRIKDLSEYFYNSLKLKVSDISINGSLENRSPHIMNLFMPYDDLVHTLSANGIFVSSGSACSQRILKPSHVLRAMGCNDKRIKNSIRISFGKMTTKKEIDYAIKTIIIISKKT